jgi:queuine tRNA-ribosyltransferase
MRIESNLGADIIMAFDECAPGTSTKEYARKAMQLTHRWADRCIVAHTQIQEERSQNGLLPQALFPIAQGVTYEDLRRESVKYIGSLPTLGMAIGGLSVGESKEDMMRILDCIAPDLPDLKPHYLMGVGTPEDLVEGIYRGIDMFDCVLPTRLGRHGVVFTSFGNLKIGLAIQESEKQ